jgi:outer membrane receptor protein involved in Fe transport
VRRTLVAALSLVVVGGVRLATAQAPTQPPPGAQAPAANGDVRGKVVDMKSDAPIARASVSVRPKGGTVLIAGAIAGGDGTFRIQGLRPGAYSLRVTFIGFAPILQDFTITNDAPSANVGTLKLSQVAVSLGTVAVTEERAAVTVEPDRNAYRAKDVAPAAANASEVLDAIPSVQVDADGKVSLRGNENVVVQINGRPTPMRGTQLASYLKSLPANIVDRIEVIPNPSAKYDPEGMAGILNIALKQNVDLGLSGAANAGFSTAERYNGSTNFGYQSGPLTSFTTVGIVKDTRAVVGVNDRERYDALRSVTSATDQDIASEMTNNGQNLNATVDYKLTPRDVLSNALSVNHRSSGDASVSAYSELNGSGALMDRYDRPRNLNAKGWMFDYDLALKRTFEPRKHELSGEVRFNRAHDQDFTTFWRQPLPVSSAVRIEGEEDDNDAIAKQLTGQIDYVKAFAARTKLETGYKGNARWLDRDFLVTKDSLGTGTWTRSNLSNDFEFDESVHAAYGVFSQGVGKFDLQGGLRAEYATRTFSLSAPAQSYPYNYASVFPSGVVMYNVNDMTQLKASYSRRIRRPGTQELNPFPSFFDVQNVFIGNPNLSPEYTDAFELGLTKNASKGTVQLSPFFRHTTNIIRVDINTSDVIEGREVTSISFKNLATSNSWGTDLNGSLRLGPRFNGFAGFNVFKMVTDGGSTSAVGSDAVTWMGRVNGTSELTKTIILQASYMYRAPMKIERGRFDAQQMANFAIRKKIDGDAASVTLRVNDPFKTGTFRVRAGDDKVMQLTERNFGARTAFLAFQYNYGRPPRVRQVQQEQGQSQPGFPPPGA